MASKVVSCSRNTIQKTIEKNPKLALLYTDKGCPVCPGYLKLVKDNMKKTQGVELVHVELGNQKEDCEATADKFNIEATPTMLYFVNGKMKRRILPTGDDKKDISVIKGLGKT